MATFGSRGGLYRIVPVKHGDEANSCPNANWVKHIEETEPFIDLRKPNDKDGNKYIEILRQDVKT